MGGQNDAISAIGKKAYNVASNIYNDINTNKFSLKRTIKEGILSSGHPNTIFNAKEKTYPTCAGKQL